jgi:hypothetical protein
MKVLGRFHQVGIKSMAEDMELTGKMKEYQSIVQLRDLESPFIGLIFLVINFLATIKERVCFYFLYSKL